MTTAAAPTRQSIATRARLAREQAGLRQEDVAARLGIPRPSVTELEAGRRDISSVELAVLADLLGKPIEWFVAAEGQFDPDAWNPVNFHLRGGDLTDNDRRALVTFASRCAEYASLEVLLDVRPEIPRARYGGLTGRHIDQGRAVALAERQRLQLGARPIGDVVALLELLGVKVLDWPMAEESAIDGALFASEETGPCILLNGDEAWTRRQFSAAHEYAHLLLDVDGDRAEVCFRNGQGLTEKRANAFAAEFLSPTDGVLEFLATLGVPARRPVSVADVIELQRYFQVSYDATLWRLLNLGLITEPQRQEFAAFKPSALARRLGYEPSDQQPKGPVSRRFRQLAIRAWQAGKITRGKLAELLDVPKRDLDGLPGALAGLGVGG